MAELDKLTPYEIACLVMYILLENENKILCTFDDLKQHKFTNDMIQILPQGHFKFPRVIDNKIQNGNNLIAIEKGKYKLTEEGIEKSKKLYRDLNLDYITNNNNDEIDFSVIENFLKTYGGNNYTKNETKWRTAGQRARMTFLNFSKKILEKIQDGTTFEQKDTKQPRWQNSGNCYNYLWVEYAKSAYKYEPYSISLAFILNTNKELQLYVKTEINDNIFKSLDDIKKQECIKNFSKSLSFNKDDFEKKPYPIKGTNFTKDVLEKEIKLKNNKNIVADTASAFESLIPCYNAIFNKGEYIMDKNIPLNQILYGPPGTGKTYNTVVKAMEIVGSEKINMKYENGNFRTKYTPDEYKTLQEEFNIYKKSGRIEFITFHQSYSYEEFVEGIKPYIHKSVWKMDNEQINQQSKNKKNILPDIKYIGTKGIFRQIVDNANNAPQKEISFDELWKIFQDKHPVSSELKTIDDISFHIKEYLEDGIKIDKNEENNPKLTTETIKTLYTKNKQKAFKTPTDIKEHYQDKPSYYFSIIKELENIEKSQKEPYVLIIDEINRGNISKIFGELITLIEEDKRKKVYEDGKEYNTLEVTLPYSQVPFYVPNNLYIIGTMNTADRSIANVDIALRRRFKFVEMMPQKDIVADYGCNFKAVFDKLNKRIAALLDRDHQIGHSYFIKEKYENANIETLKDIWFDSVMPLLNEYFYGDWEKLQAILGKAKDEKGTSFIVSHKTNNLFATPDNENPCDDDYYDFREKSAYYDTNNFIAAMKYAFEEFGETQESQETQEQKETQEINNNNIESQ